MAEKYVTPLQRKRLKCGLTQNEVSAAACVTSRHYQSIEQYRVMPGVLTALRIAIMLRTSVETLWHDALE
jgi:DNA-binding XRE family transcriptional regulator